MTQLKRARSVLGVNDLRRSVDFYRDQLGFAVAYDADGWCFMARGGFRIMLGHCPDAVPASQLGDHSYLAYVEVDDVDALHEEFRARGLAAIPVPRSKPWGMREFLVTTPDGHRIMFGQDLDPQP